MQSRSGRLHSIAAYVVLAAALVLFGVQLRTLYTVPVFDSVRWGGDETWLMREFGNQALHGVMSYPESFGGPQRTDGVLAGSMWVDAFIYGLPGALLFPAHDYISVGRTVTAILSLLLLGSVYYILRKLGVSPLLAALSVAVVVASRGFVWASHSARYDLLTGLTLLWYCYVLSRQTNPSPRRMFALGILGVLTICFSRHLLLLGTGASIVFLYQQEVWKHTRLLWPWLAGSASAAILLSIVYFAGAHEFSLFGRGGSEGSYTFVLNQIPIFRPFSRNVQVSNLMERLRLFERDAPGVLLLVGVSVLSACIYFFSRQRKSHTTLQDVHSAKRFWWSAAVLCAIVWILTEGSRPYYLFHIVPLLVIACAIAIQDWEKAISNRAAQTIGIIILGVAIALGIRRAVPGDVLGSRIATDQTAAIHSFLKEASIQALRASRILLDVAGLDRALTDTSRAVLTLDMFQPPHEWNALVQKLKLNNIDYVILRSSPVGIPFEPGRALLPHVLDSIGTVRDTKIGFFYDDGRSYDASLAELYAQGLDTLKLYRLSHP